LTFDGAFYDKNTKNQIIAAALAPETGYTTTRTRNVGKIGNKGIEIMLGGTPIKRGDWKWDIGCHIYKELVKG
jgi:outer membrane receptor protein involved in Fe transport